MVRPKTSLPFLEAREFIRTQSIGSKSQYLEWHKANKPKALPRYPHRSYTDEWKGWNDFLGTDNKFDKTKRSYRPLAEALVYIHKLGLGSEREWLDYIRQNRETVPSDIPGRPDLVYDDWRSWMHWLGSKPIEKIEAQRQVLKESAIFYVIRENDYANQRTVFTFGLERGGVSGLKDRWEREKNFTVIKMFEYDETQNLNVQRVINTMSTPYYGAEDVRIVPSINQLLWEISNYLMFARSA